MTSWTPIFKGIDYAKGTNTPTTTYPNRNVMHAMRVDLQDPDIQLFTTPRISDYADGSSETGGETVSNFLKQNHLQVAVNASLFDPSDYYLPAGTPMDVYGLAISRGVVVSPEDSRSYAACFVATSNNVAEIIHTNWPARSNDGVYTAVAGDYAVLAQGVNVGYQYKSSSGFVHQRNPRTAFGLSQDKRYLFLLTIDGRQSGYSDGALDYETGAWLLLLGADDGVNLDGGGSTTLVMQDSTGVPLRLNRSSAVADSGNERTVGSHFGVFAKPVPGFIADITVVPDDKTALVTWTTMAPASGQVNYGSSTNLGNASALQADLTTNHSLTLTGLTPSTRYYYQVTAGTSSNQFKSPILAFSTTNYVATNVLIELTNAWRYTTANLDGVNWTTPEYDDFAWNGPFPAVFYADTRGGNTSIPEENSAMPLDSATRYPFTTYYFRSSFNLESLDPGMTLYVSAHIDDGAVFYLNGIEVYRVRMPEAPASIAHADFATGTPCSGDATCAHDFQLPSLVNEILRTGENVLAIEVHNYASNSHDVTFGASVTATVPSVRNPPAQMQISYSANNVTISWTGSGFTLQQASNLDGNWVDVPGSAVTSPWQVPVSGQAQYYRIRK